MLRLLISMKRNLLLTFIINIWNCLKILSQNMRLVECRFFLSIWIVTSKVWLTCDDRLKRNRKANTRISQNTTTERFFFFKTVSSKQPRKNKINLLGSGGFQFSTTPIACYHEGYVNFMKLKDRRNQQWKSIGSLLFHTYFVLCEKMILEARVE